MALTFYEFWEGHYSFPFADSWAPLAQYAADGYHVTLLPDGNVVVPGVDTP